MTSHLLTQSPGFSPKSELGIMIQTPKCYKSEGHPVHLKLVMLERGVIYSSNLDYLPMH